MRKTYDGTQYRYRKVRELDSKPSGFAKRMMQRTLIRIEYCTKADPDTLRDCHAIREVSYSFGDRHCWYVLCDAETLEEFSDDRGIRYTGSTLGEMAMASERRIRERGWNG